MNEDNNSSLDLLLEINDLLSIVEEELDEVEEGVEDE